MDLRTPAAEVEIVLMLMSFLRILAYCVTMTNRFINTTSEEELQV